MPKITKDKDAKIKNFSLTEGELQMLAHRGTKEAIAKIEDYIKSEKNQDKRAYAELALEECELFYYQPMNEKEEQDFTLCRLINENERRIGDLNIKADRIRGSLDKFKLEQKVHKQVLAGNKSKREAWQYHYMDDFMSPEKNQLLEITDDIAYKKAWIEAAKKMITSVRYKDGIPERHLSHYCFDDDQSADDGGCDCGDDACAFCGSDEIAPEIKDVPF